MSPSIKDEIQRLPGPLQTLPIKLVEVKKFTLTTYRYSTRLVKSTSGQCIILLRRVFGLMVKQKRVITFSI